MNFLLSKITSYWSIFLLSIVLIFVFVTNYTPGTYLTGWDNLHPEFNFFLNIERSLFAVWQEYQGLGLLGGMGHASDLPRQIFLWIVSFILPNDLLRYFYHFLMLSVGVFGVYRFLSDIVFENAENAIRTKGAVLGSLFYLLNLGTAQYFFVPFEPYSTFWGMFPWEIYTLFRFLSHPSKRNLLFLAIVNFLATAQGYVQTVFLVYIIFVSLILLINFLRQKTRKNITHGFLVLATIFVVNAFWLLPNLYFVATKLPVTQRAMQNEMATEKFFQMNKARGTLADFPLLREFYYDIYHYDETNGEFFFLMQRWRDHLENPLFASLGYLFFFVILWGLLFSGPRLRPYLLSMFALCALIFLSDTPVISSISAIMREVGIVNQIFRNPFTKFIVPTIFIFSVGFSLGFTKFPRFSNVLFALGVLLLVLYAYPSFNGNLISQNMRLAIPQEYFDMFSYFGSQDKNARIMNLPQGSYWGWTYYTWGAIGSGFIWYGIEQPITDRAFDVWSTELENYYWQLNLAVKKRDKKLFNDIVEKYQISYILIDNNIKFTDGLNSRKATEDHEDLLANNDRVLLDKTFGNIRIYKTLRKNEGEKNILLGSGLPSATNWESYTRKDNAFGRVGFYREPGKDSPDFIFPFGSLFTNRFQKEHSFRLEENKDTFRLINGLPEGTYTLTIPSLAENESLLPVAIGAKRQNNTITIQFSLQNPRIGVDNQQVPNNVHMSETHFLLPTVGFGNNFFISINNRDFFPLGNLSEEYQTIGSTLLINAPLANYVKLYSSEGGQTKILDRAKFLNPTDCGAPRGKTVLKSEVREDSLVLTAQNTALCQAYEEAFSGFGNALLNVSLGYISKNDEFPKYCVFSTTAKTCLNNKDSRHGFSSTKKIFNDYFESGHDSNDIFSFQAILEAVDDEDQGIAKSITYSDIAITSYPYLGRAIIDVETLQDIPMSHQVKLAKGDVIRIEIPKLTNSFSFTEAIDKNLYNRTPLNYDKVLPGTFQLEEQRIDGKKSLRAKATNASSYILFRATDLVANYGYLVNVETRNTKQFPFVINIFTNRDFRNHLYTFVEKGGNFQENYFVLPPYYEFDKGLNVLLGATSYNNTETVDEIQNLSVYPIPYAYITNVYLQKTEAPNENNFESNFEVTKYNPSLYRVHLTDKRNETLILSQAFDPGWKAYEVQSSKFKMQSFLPFLFGEEIKDHVLVNNWENGWLLDNQDASGEVSIVIVYLPQYLQYFGFGILGITLGVIVVTTLRKVRS